jgi:hypothetical protein
MPSPIKSYNSALQSPDKQICNKLLEIISKDLKTAESKLWHGHPVWFLEGNPIVGYHKLKDGVRILFWSGQSFKDTDLLPEGSFKAAEMRYADIGDVKIGKLRGWLKQAKKIQWDYKNIVKHKGTLVKIGEWK